MKTQTIVTVVVILLLIGGAFYFVSQTNNPQPAQQNISQSNPTPTGQIGGGPGEITQTQEVKAFEVSGKPFEFNPKEIRVKLGDVVRVNFTNTEGIHNWTLNEFNVKTRQLQAGQSEIVQFTANKAGTFEYYCSVGNHRQMGMVGKLIVEQ